MNLTLNDEDYIKNIIKNIKVVNKRNNQKYDFKPLRRFKKPSPQNDYHGIASEKLLNHRLDKLNKKRKKYIQIQKDLTKFRQEIKTTPFIYYDINKRINKMNREKWVYKNSITRYKKIIATLPIIPLIIPRPLDIN